MFDAILNRIAERSQAIKDKDAEIATWEETATEQELRINGLIEENKAALAMCEDAVNSAEAADARAEAAESQLAQIAEALDIEHVIQVGLTPEAEAVEEVAAANAMPDAPTEEPAAEEAEAPATEGLT